MTVNKERDNTLLICPSFRGQQYWWVNGNFGCGSSREHAPQAIAKWGIKAIIGESFAEIFFGNCIAIGVPCFTATPAVVQQLQSQLVQHPETLMEIDLDQLVVNRGDMSTSISMDDGPRQMMLAGTWDACGQLLDRVEQVKRDS